MRKLEEVPEKFRKPLGLLFPELMVPPSKVMPVMRKAAVPTLMLISGAFGEE